MNIETQPFRVHEAEAVDLGTWATLIKPLCKSRSASAIVLLH